MIAEPPAARAAFLSMRRELVGDPDAAKKILLANWTARARDRGHAEPRARDAPHV